MNRRLSKKDYTFVMQKFNDYLDSILYIAQTDPKFIEKCGMESMKMVDYVEQSKSLINAYLEYINAPLISTSAVSHRN